MCRNVCPLVGLLQFVVQSQLHTNRGSARLVMQIWCHISRSRFPMPNNRMRLARKMGLIVFEDYVHINQFSLMSHCRPICECFACAQKQIRGQFSLPRNVKSKKTRKCGNYSDALPPKAARRNSISNWTSFRASNLSCRRTQCRFV